MTVTVPRRGLTVKPQLLPVEEQTVSVFHSSLIPTIASVVAVWQGWVKIDDLGPARQCSKDPRQRKVGERDENADAIDQ